MPTATNFSAVQPKAGDPAPGAVTGAADLFAALIAGIAPGSGKESAAGDGTDETAADALTSASGENDDQDDSALDIATLLPMIDQQRAAIAAPVILSPSGCAAEPGKVEIENAGDLPPVMRPLTAKNEEPVVQDRLPAGPKSGVATVDPVGRGLAPITNHGADTVRIVPDNGAEDGLGDAAPGPTAVSDRAAPTANKPSVTPLSDMKVAVTGKRPETPAAMVAPVVDPPSEAPMPAAPAAGAQPEPSKPVIQRVRTAMIPTAPATSPGQTPVAEMPANGPVDPAPVARPATATDAATPETIAIATPVQTDVPAAVAAKLAQGATAPAAAASQPDLVAVAERQAVVAATIAQSAPIPGQPAPQRPVRIAPAAEKAIGEVSAKAADTIQSMSQAMVQPPADAVPPSVATTPLQPANATPPATAPAQDVAADLSAQVLDMSKGNAWIDQLARDISGAASKDGIMRFALTPESLGELKIEIQHSDKGAHIRMHVGSEAAQQALADASSRLTSEARAQGVRIAETEISFTGGQAQQHGREAARQDAQPHQAPAPRMMRGSGSAVSTTITDGAAAATGRARTERYA